MIWGEHFSECSDAHNHCQSVIKFMYLDFNESTYIQLLIKVFIISNSQFRAQMYIKEYSGNLIEISNVFTGYYKYYTCIYYIYFYICLYIYTHTDTQFSCNFSLHKTLRTLSMRSLKDSWWRIPVIGHGGGCIFPWSKSTC